jgi:hypothetical protein
MLFVRERRCKISNANPDMPVLQIMKEVGSQWQSLHPEEKQVYQAMADEDKIRYKEELKEFEKEVEKLQDCKPEKMKRKLKTKEKSNDVKIETIMDTEDTVKQKPQPPAELETKSFEVESPKKNETQSTGVDNIEDFREEF